MCGRVSFAGRESGVESLGPRAQVIAALAVLGPVVLSGLFLVTFAPGLWWIFTTYGWVAFPAFGLLLRGLTGSSSLSGNRAGYTSANDKERELLEALRREGELTPILATMGTSLTVAEADRMLKELAEGGHLEVRGRGGGLSYALWGAESPPRNGAVARAGVLADGARTATVDLLQDRVDRREEAAS